MFFYQSAVIWCSLIGIISANYAVFNINKGAAKACGGRPNVQRTDIRAVFDSTGANNVKFYGLNNKQQLQAAIAAKANIPLVATLNSNSKTVSLMSYFKGRPSSWQKLTAAAQPYTKGKEAKILTSFQANTWKNKSGVVLVMSQSINNGETILYDYTLSPGSVDMVPMYLAVDGDFKGDVTFYQYIVCKNGKTWKSGP
ncbi:unnamed protein product, partial [Mesorhabditis spiculigera]